MLMKILTERLLKPVLSVYLKFNTVYRFANLKLIIRKGVFHPAFFFSSEIMANFIQQQQLKNLYVLEPCCGSGLLSMLAYSRGAHVTATDINPLAVSNTLENFKRNFSQQTDQKIEILCCDIFPEKIPVKFDRIFINPPYFFKRIKTPAQWAWNAGENGELFHSFFSRLASVLSGNGTVYMILADNCEINRIMEIAEQYQFTFRCVLLKKKYWENNYIYEIKFKHAAG